jgi:Tol biopolymer transport system component
VEEPRVTLSPDGRSAAYYDNLGGNVDIYLASLSGGRPRRLTHDRGWDTGPAWSPDGGKIAFVRRPSDEAVDTTIYVMSRNGSRQRRMAALGAYSPVWSPDGHKIAFLRGKQLFVINSDGTNERALPGSATRLAWSPDSRQNGHR